MKLTESAPVQPIEIKRLAPWVIYRDATGWIGVTPLMARDLKDAMGQKDLHEKHGSYSKR